MGFIENIRVSKERAKAGFGAEQDRPSVVFGTREISGIRIAENPPTQGDKLLGWGFGFCYHRVYALRLRLDDKPVLAPLSAKVFLQ
jgi:hypothetical protein